MPISERELSPHKKPSGTLITDDRKCRGCAYNLRGLRDDSNCPECGRPIRKKELASFTDHMTDAPASWVGRYRIGTALLCVGGWTMALGLLGWGIVGHIVLVSGALAGSVAWAIGTVIATRPRPKTRRMQVNPAMEWARWRMLARLSQPGWCIALAGLVVIQMLNWYSPPAIIPVAMFVLIGVVGWWPLMLVQSNLAYWAGDSELSDKLRNCSWASALGMGIGAAMVGIVGGLNGGLTGGYAVIGYLASATVLGVWLLLGAFSLWYTLSAVWQLARLGVWVSVAQTNVLMRDERLRERARRASAGIRADENALTER